MYRSSAGTAGPGRGDRGRAESTRCGRPSTRTNPYRSNSGTTERRNLFRNQVSIAPVRDNDGTVVTTLGSDGTLPLGKNTNAASKLSASRRRTCSRRTRTSKCESDSRDGPHGTGTRANTHRPLRRGRTDARTGRRLCGIYDLLEDVPTFTPGDTSRGASTRPATHSQSTMSMTRHRQLGLADQKRHYICRSAGMACWPVRVQTRRSTRETLLGENWPDTSSARSSRSKDRTTRRERELERKNNQLERFASVVSHDLRNPLQVATGTSNSPRQTRVSIWPLSNRHRANGHADNRPAHAGTGR